MRKTMLYALASALAGAAQAQPWPADTADGGSKVPPVQYRSVFESYRPFSEQEVGNWRRANDEVGEVGGHKGHLPGQGRGESPPAKPPAGQKAPAAKDHGGHK